ncbi:RHS repeat-associated core domain protein [Nostoc sp. PCC 7524]|uniref:Ig-like domain-containing protein n=1 Tax=Nostoc sp. (strain ATCC 29411 / PCC 7524) TaxID=28072 RepID=UPI00029F0809|nr:Ig-like domain-containing protein [Nostoc sp. PCC 7524]AFY47866.1 RHS repeat-associated core domain protein [Nostoc sp. PCC 7524]
MYNEFNVFDQGNSSLDFQYPLLDQSLFPSPERLRERPSGLMRVDNIEIPSLTPTTLAPNFAIHSNFSGLHSLVDPLVGTSPVVNREAINLALSQVGQSFEDFLQKPNYIDSLQVAFGSGWQQETATALIKDLAQGQNLLAIEVVTGQELEAQGAFSQQTNTIYLAQEFVQQNPTNAIATVLTEELGHYIDSQLNPVDTPGDEGELFAAIVDGVELTPGQLQAIKVEDDHKIVTINGQTLLVEQSVNEIVGTGGRDVLTGTPLSDRIIGGTGADIITGGLGADVFVYQSIRDAGDTIKDFELRQDVIDVSQVLSSFGYQGLNPIADGYIKFSTYTGGTIILIDSDGTGSLSARPYIYVENVTPNDLSSYSSHFIPNPGEPPQIEANLVNDTGVSDSDRLTFDPTINGKVTATSNLVSLKAGLNNQPVTVDIFDTLQPDGTFSLTSARLRQINGGSLNDGAYTLKLQAIDNKGNISSVYSFNFVLDTTAPNLNLQLDPDFDSAPVGDLQTNFETVNLVGTTEANLIVSLQQTGVSNTSNNLGQFSFADISLTQGNNLFTVVAKDLAGNQGEFSQTFQRLVQPVNAAPTNLSLIPASSAENVPDNTTIGTFTTTDPDVGDTHTYSLVAGEGDTDNTAFTIVGNELRINDSPNFETKSSYSIRVRTTDAGGLSYEQVFNISITNVNEAPTDILLDGDKVEENAVGAVVGTISVTDPDLVADFLNNTVTVNDDRFEVVNNNGTLQLKLKDERNIDYEVETTVPLTLTATDVSDSSLTYSKNFTINVTDVNENVQLPTISAALANDTGVSNSDRLTQDPTVNGQITDATTLQGNLNGNGFVDISDALNEDGSFTISLEQYDVLSNGALPDGDYTLELKAKNITGQESEIVTISFILDLTPPPLTFGLAPESDTGILGDGITSDRFVTLEGQTEPGLTVALLETQQMLTADSQGNFSFIDVPMPVAGQAPFTIVAVDTAGNQGRSQQFLTREGINGAPEITSTPESIFDTQTQSTYTYQITATDPDGDDLTYTLLNAPLGTEIDENRVLSFTPSADLKPFYEFTVEVNDGRGGTDIQTFTVEVPAFANFGTIRGIKWNDLNGNGVRDNELVQGANPDVVYVLDVSGSADFGFVGSPIGDFNGDGLENTRLDAEIAAFIALNQQLNSQGLGDRAQVAIVVYSGFAAHADMNLGTNGLQLTTTLGTDSNSDGTTDVEEILRSIRSGAFGVGNNTGTNPEVALRKVEETFASIGTQTGNGNVIFLTDGEQNRGGSIVDEVERLKAQGFNLSAFGVGNDASLSVIQTIDPDGTKFTSIDDILDAFGGIGEGSRSVLEPGLAGVSIYLDINNNGILDSGEPVQVTAQDDPNTLDIDETGQYEFNNLAPGTYIVREIIPDGFEQTFPLRNVTRPGDGYADIILEFVSGGNAPSPLIEPYGSTGGLPSGSPFNGNGRYTVEPVNPEVILGAPPPSPIIGRNPEVDWLALPLGSYVTVGFTDEVIIDGPGDDIFIRSFDPIDSANEFADVFVSSNGIDFELLGTINQRGLVSLDLANINFTKPVIAVRVQGLDNRGTSPGFDLISVEVLPGSIASPDFYTVQLEAGEIVENIDFGNVQIAINQDPIITSTPIIEAVVGQPYEYLVRANDPDGDPLTFSLNQAPEGMVIDPQTGRISYTPTITAITSNFDTSDSQIRPGADNQATFTNISQFNFTDAISDYAIGEGFNVFTNLPVGPVFRSAVSFDLSSLSSQVTSAKLQLLKNRTSGDPIETLGLFEVTTEINQLYTNRIGLVSPEIFEDLGTGTSYGTFDVATGGNPSEILEFELNEAAIAAINAASGDFFSIGLALLSANPNNTTQAAEYLFAFSGNAGIQRLVLETENKETVEILVNDGKGGEAVQNYTLSIVESSDNQPPVITSTPTISIALGETYEYQIEATDPNADSLTYSLINFPDGMEIDEFGKITWIPTEIGEFTLEIAVSDGRGGADTQIYRIEVVRDLAEDTEAPQVNLSFNSTVLKLGETLNLQIQGFDNIGLADLDLSFNGNSLVLTPDTVTNGLINTASITLNKTGVFEVVATATDFSGNTDTETISIRVINPNDTQAPITELDLSGFDPLNPVISELTDIVGTINDPDLEFYRVELAPVSLINLSNPAANDPDYITIAEGRANVDNGVLAQIDPNLYRNDSYYIRVYTQDYSGNANVQGVVLGINSQNKPGRFALEFTDLSIPLTGIPIEIQRRYDSLDAKFSGDFGYGWSLGLQDAQIQEAAPTGVDLSRDNFFGGNSFTVGTRVTLTTPDGRRVGFTFNPVPDLAGLLGVRYKPTFTPDAGVYDRLEVDYTPLSIRSDGSVGLYLFGFTYNPSQYRLITKDGTTYRYDQYKGLLDITDRNGNKLTYTDAGIFSSTGQSVNFNRDAQGRITEIIDPAGQGIIYNYDAQGNLVSVTDQAGLSATHTYSDSRPHYLEQIVDPRGNIVIKTEYDPQGRVIGVTDALGNIISNSYDVNATGSSKTQIDPLGNTTTTVWDDRGNVISIRDQVGAITTFTYDANNNPITVTDPRGFTTTRTFDTRGNLTSITNALGNSRTFTYDQFNNVITDTNSLGHITQFIYDANGNLVQVINATNQSNRFTYDNLGRVNSFIDANGNAITFSYANTTLGKPTQITFSDGSTQQIEYNQFGQITRLVDENGHATTYITDSIGRLIAQRDPLGNEITYTYDAQLITSVTDSLGNAESYEYDNAGQLIRRIDPFNGVTQLSYDALGRRISETDPLGNTTTTTYRGDGLITAITDAAGNTTYFEYDLAGNQTAVIDPLGNRTAFTYDALGRQIMQTDPLGNVTTYNYDAVNNLIAIIDRNNRQRTFTYDAVNRLLQENWLVDDTPVQIINFTYDAVGNLISVTNPDITNTFVYDSRDRVIQASTEISGLSPVVLTYTYDRTGNRISASDNLGVSVNSTYDPRNLLTSQTWQGTGIDPVRIDYAYNSRGDRTQIQRFSDLTGTQLIGSSTFNYDALQRLTEITHFDGAGSTLASYNYNYNAASLINSEIYKGQTTNYTYDSVNQLTNADRSILPDGNYNYDENGNPIGNGFVVGANNQILSDGTFNYSYDAEGSLVTKTNIATGNVTNYVYDFRNRLIEVVNKNADGNTTQFVEFKYDGFGRRISKTVNGETTYFINEGNNLWSELNEVGEVINRYLHGAKVDELIARYSPNERTSWYLTDRLGTVRDVANTVGELINSIDYNSFGQILAQTNPSAGDRFTFTGREYDEEIALYYYRARYYDANLGRFISQDPIGFAGQDVNLYRYVGNNPVNATDPSGLIAAIEYKIIIDLFVLGEPGSFIGALIGFLQGFGATNLVFIGNILEIANAGGDVIAEWGTAIDRTIEKMEEIQNELSRFNAVDIKQGLVSGFVDGAGLDVVKIQLKIPDLIVSEDDPFFGEIDLLERGGAALGIPTSIDIPLKGGGFEDGYREARIYLESLNPRR